MAEYIVDILDQDLKAGVRGQQVIDFDEGVVIKDVLEDILEAFNLPRTDSRGEERRYMLGYNGEVLDLNALLAHSVPAGGNLVLSSDASVA